MEPVINSAFAALGYSGKPSNLTQHNGPLNGKAEFRHGGDAAADQDARKPSVEQAGIRCTSACGRTERNAHPITYAVHNP